MKGLDLLVEAAALVPEARFVIAGEGPERERLEARIAELGEGRTASVCSAGAAMSARCSPQPTCSWSHRGATRSPLTILEALAAGTPVVATARGRAFRGDHGRADRPVVAPEDPPALARRSRAARRCGTRATQFAAEDGRGSRALLRDRDDATRRGVYTRLLAGRAGSPMTRPHPSILIYHQVGEPRDDPFHQYVSADELRRSHGDRRARRPVGLIDLAAEARAGAARRGIAVTFDDGYPATCASRGRRSSGWACRRWCSSRPAHGQRARLLVERPGATPSSRRRARRADLGCDRPAGARTAPRRPTRSSAAISSMRPGRGSVRSEPADLERALADVRRWAGLAPPGPPAETVRCMTVAELGELMRDEIVDIGAHTRTHPLLAARSPAEQRDEIAGGRTTLEEWLDRPVTDVRLPLRPAGRRLPRSRGPRGSRRWVRHRRRGAPRARQRHARRARSCPRHAVPTCRGGVRALAARVPEPDAHATRPDREPPGPHAARAAPASRPSLIRPPGLGEQRDQAALRVATVGLAERPSAPLRVPIHGGRVGDRTKVHANRWRARADRDHTAPRCPGRERDRTELLTWPPADQELHAVTRGPDLVADHGHLDGAGAVRVDPERRRPPRCRRAARAG